MNFKYYKTERLIVFSLVLYVLCLYVADAIELLLIKCNLLSKINHLVHTFSTLTLLISIFLFINHVGWKLKIFKWLIVIRRQKKFVRGER